MRRVEDLNATRRIDQRDTSKLNFPCVKLIDSTRRFYQANVPFLSFRYIIPVLSLLVFLG